MGLTHTCNGLPGAATPVRSLNVCTLHYNEQLVTAERMRRV